MSNLAISARDIGKCYQIGRVKKKDLRHRNLGQTIIRTCTEPFVRIGHLLRGNADAARGMDEEIWALREVNFDIEHGEVVGLIGRNGAGKSTLLKVLARITEPSTGHAEIRGRVGSLLEVGTGFHQELTGRENVFLNGSILGMTRREILTRFDEIVDFAEMERFIDTPVKHYSSGMLMRLAFAVAAHLEPEILIIDEVLAVGDVRFQRKCLNKMEDVGQHGRTVLFVSHNMPAVTRLCPRAILLEDGRVAMDGPAHELAAMYLHSEHGTSAHREWPDPGRAPRGPHARLCSVIVRDEHGEIAANADIRRPVVIEMNYEVTQAGAVLAPYFDIYNEDGLLVFSTGDHHDPHWKDTKRDIGPYQSQVTIPGNFLSEGIAFVTAGLIGKYPTIKQFEEREAVAFHVIDTMDGDSVRGDWGGEWKGVIRPKLDWHTLRKTA